MCDMCPITQAPGTGNRSFRLPAQWKKKPLIFRRYFKSATQTLPISTKQPKDTNKNGKAGTKGQCIESAMNALKDGKSVFIDRCNVEKEQRDDFVKLGGSSQVDVHAAVVLDLPAKLCILRYVKRTGHEGNEQGGKSGKESKEGEELVVGSVGGDGSLNDASTLAFPSISTADFQFDLAKASDIIVEKVLEFRNLLGNSRLVLVDLSH